MSASSRKHEMSLLAILPAQQVANISITQLSIFSLFHTVKATLYSLQTEMWHGRMDDRFTYFLLLVQASVL